MFKPHILCFYQPNIGVDNALIDMLQTICAHLDTSGATARIMFFEFSLPSTQSSLQCEKMRRMQVESAHVMSSVMDYLTCRPQYVRLQSLISGMVLSSTGALWGTVLSPFLFTMYTADFQYNTDNCFSQKFSDDNAALSRILCTSVTSWLYLW